MNHISKLDHILRKWRASDFLAPVTGDQKTPEDEAKAAIKDLFLELISEDEEIPNRCFYCGQKECCGGDIPDERNHLRAELRERIKNL